MGDHARLPLRVAKDPVSTLEQWEARRKWAQSLRRLADKIEAHAEGVCVDLKDYPLPAVGASQDDKVHELFLRQFLDAVCAPESGIKLL